MELDAAFTIERDVPPQMRDDDSLGAITADLHDFLGRHILYPSEDSHVAHTLWCMHAHLMEHWDTTPRLLFCSKEPASGKSRALEVTATVVPNAMQTVNASTAAVIRVVGDAEAQPTLLWDEIDTVFGDKAKDNEDIRGLLNAGYRRGQKSLRCVMHGKTAKVEEIPAYCAVAMAGLGYVPDTILTRCVVVRMKRRKPGQKVEQYRCRLHEGRGHAIRDRLTAWAASVERIEYPELPEEIQDRDAEVWEPLIVVADMIGGKWPKVARVAAVALVAKAKDLEPTFGIKLLSDIMRVFIGRDILATNDLLSELNALEESPWGECNFGKPMTAQGLAKQLRGYDIRSSNIRMGSGVLKGYRKADFAEAWEMYLPATHAEAATPLQPDATPFD